MLAEALGQKPKRLRSLVVNSDALGDEAAAAFAEALSRPGAFGKLSLKLAEITDKGATAMAELLRTNTGIRVLDLGNDDDR